MTLEQRGGYGPWPQLPTANQKEHPYLLEGKKTPIGGPTQSKPVSFKGQSSCSYLRRSCQLGFPILKKKVAKGKLLNLHEHFVTSPDQELFVWFLYVGHTPLNDRGREAPPLCPEEELPSTCLLDFSVFTTPVRSALAPRCARSPVTTWSSQLRLRSSSPSVIPCPWQESRQLFWSLRFIITIISECDFC